MDDDEKLMIMLIEADDIDINKALDKASEYGHVDIIKMLIDKSATNGHQ